MNWIEIRAREREGSRKILENRAQERENKPQYFHNNKYPTIPSVCVFVVCPGIGHLHAF